MFFNFGISIGMSMCMSMSISVSGIMYICEIYQMHHIYKTFDFLQWTNFWYNLLVYDNSL